MKNSNLKQFSQTLRNNLTDVEQKIWYRLRQRQLKNHKFRRQQIIGRYIVDFVCLERKLIIEIDGGQHTEECDKVRTEFLQNEGYKVLRFWNNDVLNNIDGILETILNELTISPPS